MLATAVAKDSGDIVGSGERRCSTALDRWSKNSKGFVESCNNCTACAVLISWVRCDRKGRIQCYQTIISCNHFIHSLSTLTGYRADRIFNCKTFPFQRRWRRWRAKTTVGGHEKAMQPVLITYYGDARIKIPSNCEIDRTSCDLNIYVNRYVNDYLVSKEQKLVTKPFQKRVPRVDWLLSKTSRHLFHASCRIVVISSN